MNFEELYKELAGMDPAEVALGAGVLGALMVIVAIGGVAWYFISALGYYKMFQKAGEAGWKAFVPYYKSYICFKFAWNTNVFWPFLATILAVQIGGKYEDSVLVGLIVLAAAIAFLVLGIKLDVRVARSFGKSKIWGVLLFFVPFVVSLILGFGKAEYIGNTTVAVESGDNA